MIRFDSDYTQGAHPRILDALVRTNMEQTCGYAEDAYSDEARALIRSTGLPVSFVAAKVGYSNFSHFSNSYKRQFGVTPQEDRQI